MPQVRARPLSAFAPDLTSITTKTQIHTSQSSTSEAKTTDGIHIPDSSATLSTNEEKQSATAPGRVPCALAREDPTRAADQPSVQVDVLQRESPRSARQAQQL